MATVRLFAGREEALLEYEISQRAGDYTALFALGEEGCTFILPKTPADRHFGAYLLVASDQRPIARS